MSNMLFKSIVFVGSLGLFANAFAVTTSDDPTIADANQSHEQAQQTEVKNADQDATADKKAEDTHKGKKHKHKAKKKHANKHKKAEKQEEPKAEEPKSEKPQADEHKADEPKQEDAKTQ